MILMPDGVRGVCLETTVMSNPAEKLSSALALVLASRRLLIEQRWYQCLDKLDCQSQKWNPKTGLMVFMVACFTEIEFY